MLNPGEKITELVESTAGVEDSSEPFVCPACGQLLAPSVRVCVACKAPIDLAQVRRPQRPAETAPAEEEPAAPPIARFSWPIFLVVLFDWLLAAAVAVRLLGPDSGQVVMLSLVLLSSVWVFFDAQARRVPKPLRWVLGTLLLWIVFFPWYLSRRRSLRALCPFVEADGGPFVRVIFLALVLSSLIGLFLMILKGPPPK